MRLLYNESECCVIMWKSRPMDKMMGRLIVRQYDWTCDTTAILRLIAWVLVPVKGEMYFAFLISRYSMPQKAKTEIVIHGNTIGKVWQIKGDKSCFDRKTLQDYLRLVEQQFHGRKALA